MSLFKQLGNVAKSLTEAFVETIAETDVEEDTSWANADGFHNSYRVNDDGEIVTDLEGKNDPQHGGHWVRNK